LYERTVCLLLLSDENEHYEMAQLSSKTTPEKCKDQGRETPITLCKDIEKKPDEEEMKHPWQTLVSYVDELTVGGRKNSKGQYADAMGKFPGFGKQKEPKVPQDCFPRQCYDTYVFKFYASEINYNNFSVDFT
jgi:voltage-gated cation channel